jgi:Bacteriophage tail sheath protein
MPEYLAPGVYVEETSFRGKSIEGVSTSTTAFAGPTRKGPVSARPEIITSFGDFERVFGGLEDLSFAPNYLAHAVRNYFDNGGSRLYVARAFREQGNNGRAAVVADDGPVIDNANEAERAGFVARMPGAAGNGSVVITLGVLPATARSLVEAPVGTFIRSGDPAQFHLRAPEGWRNADDNAQPFDLSNLPNGRAEVLTMTLEARDASGRLVIHEDLAFDRLHPRWIGGVFGVNPARRRDQMENLYGLSLGSGVSALDLFNGLFANGNTRTFRFSGGNDGAEPNAESFRGPLEVLVAQEDVSIVAAPGSSTYAESQAIQNLLIGHAETRRAYRIAVLDSRPGIGITDVATDRGLMDSKYAALYYPWVVVANPNPDSPQREIALPPSGFVCGIYARNDVERGVSKTPANEVVRGALRFEVDVNFGQQESLNPLGVNCLRYLSGRGNRVWGGRTISSDPEWKYVNVRRYFNYLEASIDRGTQWAVFENNGERLWANVRETIESFLYNEWVSGNLLGGTTKEAFFVRCDRSTMTQNDLDNGRLICLIGVAVLKPAEFVIFRIGQKTADARN